MGEIDIVIDAQGLWLHEGGQIKRQELVRLFASILWHEDGEYFLVTPAEKLLISVMDVPFVVQQMERVDDVWVATVNTAQTVIVGSEHPVSLRDYQGQKIPYVRVRYDLWARLSRAVYYQWVSEALEHSDEQPLSLKSGDYRIALQDDES